MARRNFKGANIVVPNAPNQNQNQNQNQARNRGPGGPGGPRDQRICNNCGKRGHIAQDCRSGKVQNNNNNNKNGGNANAQQNQNGRGPKHNNGHNANAKIDPNSTQPDDECYMHPGRGHNNNQCKNPRNVWCLSNSNNNNVQPPQGPRANFAPPQGPRNQYSQTGYGDNRPAVPGAGFNYCERCNEVGHIATRCERPAIQQTKTICHRCKNVGHCHTDCNHPAFCKNCTHYGHYPHECLQPPAFEVVIKPSQADKQRNQPQHVFPFRAANANGNGFQSTSNASGITKVKFADAKGRFVLEKPYNEVQETLTAIYIEEDIKRRRAIADKCYRAHTWYSMTLLNDAIIAGADFFRRVDPANPQIPLSPRRRNDNVERLFQCWINDNAFWQAAATIHKGWNYFRDPRVMDAIARSAKPVCHCCSRQGHIFSATFCELFPGTDVLTVEDYEQWGPMVAFSCGCSVKGYTFIQAEDERQMDCSC